MILSLFRYLCRNFRDKHNMLRVQSLCKEKGVSMQELASAIGISYQSLYDCLKGNPTLKRLHEIANALGVDVRELFEQQQDSFACPHCGKPIRVTLE